MKPTGGPERGSGQSECQGRLPPGHAHRQVCGRWPRQTGQLRDSGGGGGQCTCVAVKGQLSGQPRFLDKSSPVCIFFKAWSN